jgi:hypothetical protein
METTHPDWALVDEPSTIQAPTAVEWSVRVILILGFAAVLALEAYLIWEGLSLL